MGSKTTLLILSLIFALGMTSACSTTPPVSDQRPTPVSNSNQQSLKDTPPAVQYSPASGLDVP
jgi:hypothetical protein